jgi:hypothetical protein
MSVGLNNNFSIPQPTGLKEEAKQKLTDRVTIKGQVHRYWEAQKYQCTLKYAALNQSDFATLASYFYSRGAPVTYTNNNSGISFTGYPTVAEDEYIPGASFLKNMEVTIVQL